MALSCFREKQSNNFKSVNHLDILLSRYDALRNSFTSQLKYVGDVDPKKLDEMVERLYTLAYNGTVIKELYKCQKKPKFEEYESTETKVETKRNSREPRNKGNSL